MYGKLFASIYDSTVADDWRGLITLQQLVVLADKDGVVRMTAASLSRRTGIPLEIIENGIEILEKPDPASQSPHEDGRRIVGLEVDETGRQPMGWRLVNYAYYRELGKKANAAERKRRQRDRDRDGSVTDRDTVTHPSRDVTHTDTDKDKNKEGADAPDDHDETIWKTGVRMLGGAESSARTLLGKLCKEHGKPKVAGAIGATAIARPADPKSYIVKILENQKHDRPAIGVQQADRLAKSYSMIRRTGESDTEFVARVMERHYRKAS